MHMTDGERARLRALWRGLIAAVEAGDHAKVKALGLEPTKWASPIDAPGGSFVLFGLARMAVAWAREPKPTNSAHRIHAVALQGAELAGQILDATDPKPRPPPAPELPFRADIDG